MAKSLSTKRRFQVCKRRSSRADLAREFQMCSVSRGFQKALWSHPLCLNEQETSRRKHCRVAAAADPADPRRGETAGSRLSVRDGPLPPQTWRFGKPPGQLVLCPLHLVVRLWSRASLDTGGTRTGQMAGSPRAWPAAWTARTARTSPCRCAARAAAGRPAPRPAGGARSHVLLCLFKNNYPEEHLKKRHFLLKNKVLGKTQMAASLSHAPGSRLPQSHREFK